MIIKEIQGFFCLVSEAPGREGCISASFSTTGEAKNELNKRIANHEKKLSRLGITDEEWRARVKEYLLWVKVAKDLTPSTKDWVYPHIEDLKQKI